MKTVCPICKRLDADLDMQGNVLCWHCGFITAAKIEAQTIQIAHKLSESLKIERNN